MKCDELKVYVPQDGYYGLEPEEGGALVEEETCYLKSEVDAAIAELIDKCQMHDFFWEGCGFAKRGFKNSIAVSEAFDKLEAENAELKQKLEDAKVSHYAEMVDAGMRERRLRRALWLARAERARDKAFEYHFKNNVEMCAKWDNVHLMLMAKAEEYK